MTLLRPNLLEPFDHIAWGVPDFDDGCAEFERRTGVAPVVPVQSNDAAVGTVSGVVWLGGETSIEILAPAPGRAPTGLGALLAALPEPTLMFWYAAYDDLAGLVADLDVSGIPTTPLEIYDLPTIAFRRAYVAEHIFDPAVPYLIQWDRRDAERAADTAPSVTVERFWVEHPDPDSLCPVYDALGIAVDCRVGTTATTRLALNTPKGVVEL